MDPHGIIESLMAPVNARRSTNQEVLTKFMATEADDEVGSAVDSVKGPTLDQPATTPLHNVTCQSKHWEIKKNERDKRQIKEPCIGMMLWKDKTEKGSAGFWGSWIVGDAGLPAVPLVEPNLL